MPEIPRGNSVPHPRSFGAFARVLSVYVREQRVLSLAQAVHKMTALPAQRLGLLDRGQIKQGMKADLVVFDPAQVRETATYDEPRTLAVGMSQVIVNGQIVLDGGQITAARPGRVV